MIGVFYLFIKRSFAGFYLVIIRWFDRGVMEVMRDKWGQPRGS